MPAVPLCVGCDQASEPRPASADIALSCVGPGLWLRTAARRRHRHCAAPTLCVGCSRYPRAPRHCSLVWAKVAGCEQPPDATLPGTVPPGAVPPSLPGVAFRGPRRPVSGGRPAGSAGSPPPENPPRSLLAAHWLTLDARLSARRSALCRDLLSVWRSPIWRGRASARRSVPSASALCRMRCCLHAACRRPVPGAGAMPRCPARSGCVVCRRAPCSAWRPGLLPAVTGCGLPGATCAPRAPTGGRAPARRSVPDTAVCPS